MDYLSMYWVAAKASNTYWAECEHQGRRIILASLPWPPRDLEFDGLRQTRHIVFLIQRGADMPDRTLSYEPAYDGDGVFLGEIPEKNVRLNRGKIPVMDRDEFWRMAFTRLFNGAAPPDLALQSKQTSQPWWRFWGR
jgi:hypothetical protein